MREAMHASGWHRAWLAVCFVLALSSGATAQDYPSRTIKLIVPTGTGGVIRIPDSIFKQPKTIQL